MSNIVVVNNTLWLDRLLRPNKLSNTILNHLISMNVISISKTTTYFSEYSSILNNLVRAVVLGGDKLYVSGDRSYYTPKIIINGKSIKSKIKYTSTRKVLDSLEKVGMIHICKGWKTPKHKQDGYVELLDSFKYLVVTTIHKYNIIPKFQTKRDVLRLVDDNKKSLKYDKGDKMFADNVISGLTTYNEFLSKQEVKCGGVELTTWLCRIFKDNFTKHGRLYNIDQIINYQTLPSETRKSITINGSHTVEVDYKALHPSILYEQEGICYEGDMYNVFVFWDTLNITATDRQKRNIIKDAFLRTLNTASEYRAVKSVVKMFMEDNKLSPTERRYGEVDMDNVEDIAEEILGAISEEHCDISHLFYSEESLTLMNIDSHIISNVIIMCLQEGIPALPLHDSCIVPIEHKERVKEVMMESYNSILGNTLNCKIEEK